ncbi:XdhC family protein [Winogradskya consettensis]|uniref:Xanthine dehydrogenase accessory factor n=1 Tax=Winogradskya consettensis TaxID=113560 RepID=A0A919SMS6_9ACTN|nr:XdhC family protein [Actinoplanes consettensis]GIM74451.1 xanthine dehydrogenase accessory factor [Actinoplanes consettensis]
MQPEQSPRHLVAVFDTPVAAALIRFGLDLGFRTTLLEPDPTVLQGPPGPHGDAVVADLQAAEITEHTDIVLTDHHRPELGRILKDSLTTGARWIGIMGNPHHEGPHLAALRKLGVPDDEIARIHRPIGLNIGSRTPAEIAVSTLAGLIADRNNRPGGFIF